MGRRMIVQGILSVMLCAPLSAASLVCESGKYFDGYANAQKVCKDCPSGQYTNANAQTRCKNCPSGKYQSSGGANSCKPCQTGKFQDDELKPSCTDCPAGKFQAKEEQSQCNDCPTGRFSETAGSVNCGLCPSGKYQDSTRQIACKTCSPTCPSGKYLDKDGCVDSKPPQCRSCTEGQYSSLGATSCTLCDTGQYQDEQRQNACKQCPSGKHAVPDSEGQDSCKDCPEGKFQDDAAREECKACAVGEYQDKRSMAACKVCQDCPEGKYRQGCSGPDAGTCKNCAAGQMKDARGDYSTQCELCSQGHYQDFRGRPSCKPCASGQYQNQAGMTECKECEAGQVQVSLQQVECTNCVRGSYQEKRGQGYCIECNVKNACAPQTYRSGCGGSSAGNCITCATCGANKYLAGCGDLDEGSCKNCSNLGNCTAGKYRNQCAPRFTCISCQEGKFRLENHDSEKCKDCVECPAGKQRTGCAGGGAGTCQACAAGKFRKGKGNEACSTCEACPEGKYRSNCGGDDDGTCEPCAPGKYKATIGVGSTKCEDCLYACPPGQARSNCGNATAGACQACPPGQYRDGVDASATGCKMCAGCPDKGKFRDGCTKYSSGLCVACPATKYQDEAPASHGVPCKDCEACTLGLYRPQCGGDSAGDCVEAKCNLEGQFANVTEIELSGNSEDGCTTCKSCPKGEERTGCGGQDQGSCVPCEAGSFKDSGLNSGPKDSSGNGLEWYKKCERCAGCEAGYERVGCGGEESGTCSPCPVGKYKEDLGDGDGAYLKCANCPQCAAGKFNEGCSNDVRGTCDVCPKGKFKSGVGAWNGGCSNCEHCPEGKYRSGCGSANATSEGECVPCATGFFKLVTGSWETKCQVCSSCGRGAVREGCGGAQSGQCESPAQGQYKNIKGAWNTTAQNCNACPIGKQRNGCGGASEGTCDDCESGKYKTLEGEWDTQCEEFEHCPQGTYRTNITDMSGAVSGGICTRCAEGRYKDIEGSWKSQCTNCSYCGEKQFSRDLCGGANRGQCSYCIVGRYNDIAEEDGTWDTECKLCLEGHFCSEGSMNQCPLGKYAAVAGSESCRDCPAGRFGNTTGARAETCAGLCRAGYVCAAGSTTDSAEKCGTSARETPSLHYCPEGSATPEQVALGNFSEGGNDAYTRTVQTMCPGGYYCVDGEKRQCEAGHRCPIRSVAPLPCGSVNVYCEEGVETETEASSGYYTVSTRHNKEDDSEIRRDAEAPCESGHKCVGGKMLDCPPGKYQDKSGQSSCKQCAAGRYGEDSSATSDACTAICPANYYCPAGSAEPLRCPVDNSTFCRQGSAEITTILLGHWINKSGGDGKWEMVPCKDGYFCPGNERIECPAGYYCNEKATAPIACGAERFYCPARSVAKQLVQRGYFSVGGIETNRTKQAKCGSASHYCNLGKRRRAKYGYYTAPVEASEELRWMEVMCEEGFMCNNGTKVRCDDGFKCRAGLSKQEECGSASRFCEAGTERPVGVGNFSVGADGLATEANAKRRTMQRVCPRGHFCRQGVKHKCGTEGANESVFCETGESEPKRVAEGSYTGPAGSDPLTRYMSTPCACPENAPCSNPNFNFYCSGDGKREEMEDNFIAVVLKEGGSSNNHSVVGKRACGTRQLCDNGQARDCPAGHQCLRNEAELCAEGLVGKFGTCTTCPDKHYEINRTTCIPCPAEGVICSNGKLVTRPDYWYEFEAMRDTGDVIKEDTEFYKCKFDGICSLNSTGPGSRQGLPTVVCKDGACASRIYAAACLGGGCALIPLSLALLLHSTLIGFSGIKCGVCAQGFGRSVGNTCKPCPSKNLLQFGSIALVLAICIAVVVILKYGLRKTERSENSPVATMKIFVNVSCVWRSLLPCLASRVLSTLALCASSTPVADSSLLSFHDPRPLVPLPRFFARFHRHRLEREDEGAFRNEQNCIRGGHFLRRLLRHELLRQCVRACSTRVPALPLLLATDAYSSFLPNALDHSVA